MKNLVILGAGTAGTMVANRMHKRLPADWALSVIDPAPVHLYQPGLLYLPFGARNEDKILRQRVRTLIKGVNWIQQGVAGVDTEKRSVRLVGGESVSYDFLVVATGTRIRPDLTPGLGEAMTQGVASDYYTLEGSQRLRDLIAGFNGGRLVLNITEMPIKCPVAPLEFVFLADYYFTKRGIRDKVEISYVTPMDGAFTRPLASSMLNRTLDEKGINVVTDFATCEVDPDQRMLRSYDEREVPFDLLVSIPTHSGAQVIEDAGLGDELAFVPTDKHTLQALDQERIFALGDCTNLPTSKAGSVAHFQAEVLEENILLAIRGEVLEPAFDGHANCFVETGFKKAMLIDFNYDVDPIPGRYPSDSVGPFALMRQSRVNYLGKRAFRWVYWNGLLPGRPIPVPTRLPASRAKQAERYEMQESP